MKGMRAAAGRIGLRTKLFAAIITDMVISVILVGVFVLANQRRLLQTMVADSLAAAERVVENKLLGKAEQALGISLAVAAMPEIVTAAVDQDRAAIVDTVVAIYEQVHAALGVDVLHVRAPYDTSLVRGQNPSLYGDVQSRGGILDSGSQGRPLLGFDKHLAWVCGAGHPLSTAVWWLAQSKPTLYGRTAGIFMLPQVWSWRCLCPA